MNTNKKPLKLAAGEAGTRFDGCLQSTPLQPACQAKTPISWLIRSNFIESLVSRPFTRERSLEADGLLICAEFLEGCGYAWN